MHSSALNYKTTSVIDSALTCKDITTNIISYLPMKEQIKSCMFVSIFWRDVINTLPLTIRIEDRNKHQLWEYDPILNVSSDGSLNNEVHCPLYSIDVLPLSVRRKITKLTLVLRLVKKHTHRYNLDSILNLFEGFSKLEDLTIIRESELYGLDVLNHPLPSLKKFKVAYDGYSQHIQSLVSVAPNLEHINTHRLHYDDLGHLLSLSGSLQKIQTHVLLGAEVLDYNDEGLNPLVDGFIDEMPSLISWQIGLRTIYSRTPLGLLKAGHHHRSPIKKPKLLDSTAMFKECKTQKMQSILLLEVVVHSFLRLKEESKEEEKTQAIAMLQNMLSLDYYIGNYAKAITSLVCVKNVGNNDVHLCILKEMKLAYREGSYASRQPYRQRVGIRESYRQRVVRFLTAPKRRKQQQKLSEFQQQNTHSFKEEISPMGELIRKYDTTIGLSSSKVQIG